MSSHFCISERYLVISDQDEQTNDEQTNDERHIGESWWYSPKRMELDCPNSGKGRGADQPSKPVEMFSSPIVHDLFNDSSWCNEWSYLGEKGVSSPENRR